MFRDLGAELSVRGLRCRGAAGGDQFHLSAPQASATHGQPGQKYILPRQQHDQLGHVRGVPHQHFGLDDPLAGAEPRARPPGQLHHRQRWFGHHDPHEHCAVLPADAKRLYEIQS